MNVKSRRLVIWIPLLLGLVVSTFAIKPLQNRFWPDSAATQSPFTAVAQSLPELPEGGEWNKSEPSHPFDSSQPLFMEGAWAENELVTGYEQVHAATAVVNNPPIHFIGYYLYQYPDAAHAEEALTTLLKTSASMDPTVTPLFDTAHGQAFTVRGTEVDEIIYWYMAAQADTVQLLMIDSLIPADHPDQAISDARFRQMVAELAP